MTFHVPCRKTRRSAKSHFTTKEENIVIIIQRKKRKSSVMSRCIAMSRYNSYKLINENIVIK